MATGASDTPLARRFAAELAAIESHRARIPIDAYTAAFIAAEPAMLTAPERRARLRAALAELVEAGYLGTSRRVDPSESPPLPRFIVLLDRADDPAVGPEAAGYPWRPELLWAARLPLRRSELDALRAIQLFLRDRGASAPTVPSGERSLEIFGDEKRLDSLRNNRRLFSAGRLSAALLRIKVLAPPFVFRRIGSGPVALVLENLATYHSVLATVPADSLIGLVVFGGGGNFAASVAYFEELMREGPASSITAIRYFGDLDRRGLEIPLAAHAAASELSLPDVRPAIALWAMLLRHGRPARYSIVTEDTAHRLVSWLPASLRPSARRILISGLRLAQEAVGTELLQTHGHWATWCGLGPPGVPRAGDVDPELRRPVQTRIPRPRCDDSVLFTNDEGVRTDPSTPDEWATWVPVPRTRAWVLGDPILDWLMEYGASFGFVRDDERPEYDPRTDFGRFVSEKARDFEAKVIRHVEQRTSVLRIASAARDRLSADKARDTLAALRQGVPVVAHAVLRNPERRTVGMADLVVRSDILSEWFPELLSRDEATVGAPGLGHNGFHYRIVEIDFYTCELTSDGHVGGSPDALAHAVKAWLHAEALARVQGYLPSAAYILGRTWKYGELHGTGCFERLARVDMDRRLAHRETTLEHLSVDAVEWIRRLMARGSSWRVLPEPSVPELYPHARNKEDQPWHTAKRLIAKELAELTLLPGMNPMRRKAAHAKGILRWDDPRASATTLGIDAPARAERAHAVLAANHSKTATLVPQRLEVDALWRDVLPIEFYVDFETVSNLDDDFTLLRHIGGQPLIAQIGCGHVGVDGVWHFAQWTVDTLSLDEENRILAAWLAHLRCICASARVDFSASRLFHWSAAEPVQLESAYRAARDRHPHLEWPAIFPWFDLCDRIARATPLGVTGAFDFGLKSIAKAMHTAGLIETSWGDGPTDGLGAMVGLWTAARHAAASGTPLSSVPLVGEIARYNETDCRVMWEVLTWLRRHR